MPRGLRATRSKDGLMRASVSVSFRVPIGHLVGAAILAYGEEWEAAIDDDRPRPQLRKAKIEESLRDELYLGGVTRIDFVPYDNNRDDVCDEIEMVVRSMYPEFLKGL